MNAKEARSLSDHNSQSFDSILTNIENAAINGHYFIQLMSDSKETIVKLIEMGYKVHSNKDPYTGMDNYICSW